MTTPSLNRPTLSGRKWDTVQVVCLALCLALSTSGCGESGGAKAKVRGLNRGGSDDPAPEVAVVDKPANGNTAVPAPGGAVGEPTPKPESRKKKKPASPANSAPTPLGASQIELEAAGPIRGRQLFLQRSELQDGANFIWTLTTSANDAKPEFPAVYFQFQTSGDEAEELPGSTVKGTLFIQKSQSGPIYHSTPGMPAEVTFSDFGDDGASGEFLSVQLGTSEGPQKIACQGRFSAVRRQPISIDSNSDDN